MLSTNLNIIDGGTAPQIVAAVSNLSFASFTIRNTGNGPMTGLGITFDGPDATMFSVITAPSAPLAPGSNTTFRILFRPSSSGTKAATLHIASNDLDENPFDIILSGLSLSFTQDRDNDGLNDASEFLMAPLGFNFQLNQSSLVGNLFATANGAGLFRLDQLQALAIGTPLLAKDPQTGLFKLTIGVERAPQLTNFFPFPMTAPQTIINGEGKLEFNFASPDNAAFFRLEAK